MASQHNSGAPSSGAAMMDSRHPSHTPSVLNNFDFSAIDDLDPSLGKLPAVRYVVIWIWAMFRALLQFTNSLFEILSEGHASWFDREAPFELRIQDPN